MVLAVGNGQQVDWLAVVYLTCI
eukprot:COSAG02_NODE_18556_length_932_cov_1.552221_1_plen_22_part_10